MKDWLACRRFASVFLMPASIVSAAVHVGFIFNRKNVERLSLAQKKKNVLRLDQNDLLKHEKSCFIIFLTLSHIFTYMCLLDQMSCLMGNPKIKTVFNQF